jgi:peptidoglycan/xylan/chitin deacetylase (PgdA/CDA1 family)
MSLMYEGGGQPISGAAGVIPDPIRNGLPDMPTNSVFQYGIYKGTPRLLDLLDKHGAKVTAFMIGHVVDKDPALAKEPLSHSQNRRAVDENWRQVEPARSRVLFLFPGSAHTSGSVKLFLPPRQSRGISQNFRTG